MKLSVTQIRIGILVLNFLLTAGIGLQAYHGVMLKVPAKPLPAIDVNLLRPGGESTPEIDIVSKIREAGRAFVAIVEPIKEPGPTEKGPGDDPPPPPVDDEGLTPGPLADKWDYVVFMGNSDNPWAILQKKDGAVSNPGLKSPLRGTTRAPTTLRSTPTTRPMQKGGKNIAMMPTDKKTLRPFDEWSDEEAKLHIWVSEITPEKLVYLDENGGFNRYALVRPTTSIYGEKGELKPKEDPEDPNNPGAKEAEEKKEVHFVTDPEIRKQKYDAMLMKKASGKISPAAKAGDPTGPASKSGLPISASRLPGALPNAQHPANTGARPPSAEEAQQLKEAMGKIQSSDKFKKASKKEREALEALMKGNK
jgi:hypothetical protein